MNYQRILLTDDGSRLASAAAPYATSIARAHGGEVVVLRVARDAGVEPDAIDAGTWAERMRAPVEPAPGSCEEFLLPRLHVDRVGSLIVRGDPRDVVPMVAQRLNVDLIVMATHAYGWLHRALLGSVTDDVSRHVGKIPVLVCHGTPPEERDPLARVAVTIDESLFSAAALEYASALIAGTGGSLELIRVLDTGGQIVSSAVPWDGTPLPVQDDPERPVILINGRRPVTPSELVVPGLHLERVPDRDVTSGIIGSARSTHCGVIAISTHARNSLERLLRGSVADELVRRFKCGAVLLVHPALLPQPTLIEAGA